MNTFIGGMMWTQSLENVLEVKWEKEHLKFIEDDCCYGIKFGNL